MEIVRYQRKELIYEDVSSRFKLVKRIFNRQYAHIYAVRLMKFKPLLEQSTHRQWGKKPYIVVLASENNFNDFRNKASY